MPRLHLILDRSDDCKHTKLRESSRFPAPITITVVLVPCIPNRLACWALASPLRNLRAFAPTKEVNQFRKKMKIRRLHKTMECTFHKCCFPPGITDVQPTTSSAHARRSSTVNLIQMSTASLRAFAPQPMCLWLAQRERMKPSIRGHIAGLNIAANGRLYRTNTASPRGRQRVHTDKSCPDRHPHRRPRRRPRRHSHHHPHRHSHRHLRCRRFRAHQHICWVNRHDSSELVRGHQAHRVLPVLCVRR